MNHHRPMMPGAILQKESDKIVGSVEDVRGEVEVRRCLFPWSAERGRDRDRDRKCFEAFPNPLTGGGL